MTVFPLQFCQSAQMNFCCASMVCQSVCVWLLITVIYTVSQKNHATLHLCITSAYVDRFSQFFYCSIQQGICNKTFVMFPTTPYICCYTTLGNLNV